jgi:predicted Zn-dependent protease with MMP-like domain
MKLSRRDFEQLVANALEDVPKQLRSYMDNVQVVVEDEPSDDLLDEMGVPEDETLFGLYTGTPLTERSTAYSALPDRIIIFRRPLIEEFDSQSQLRREIARTIIHEIAHHFGIGDERLAELGWD